MCQTVFEFAWRVTQQLLIFDQNVMDYSRIKGWGSGFFFMYRDYLFLVTADHCIHYDDYTEGRLGKDDKVCVVNNIYDKKEWRSTLTPFGVFFYFDKSDPNCPEIPDLLDFAFAMRENSFPVPFLTRELKIGDDIICSAEKEKFIIKQEAVSDFREGNYYVCTGTVQNKIVNGMFNSCANALYVDLQFKGGDSEGNAILSYPYDVIYESWAGLSGGPVFDNEWKLVGVLVSVSESTNTVIAVPIKKIMCFMDYAIKYEEDAKE